MKVIAKRLVLPVFIALVLALSACSSVAPATPQDPTPMTPLSKNVTATITYKVDPAVLALYGNIDLPKNTEIVTKLTQDNGGNVYFFQFDNQAKISQTLPGYYSLTPTASYDATIDSEGCFLSQGWSVLPTVGGNDCFSKVNRLKVNITYSVRNLSLDETGNLKYHTGRLDLIAFKNEIVFTESQIATESDAIFDRALVSYFLKAKGYDETLLPNPLKPGSYQIPLK